MTPITVNGQNTIIFLHFKYHVKPCLKCNKIHVINSQPTYTHYVKNEKVHYMTETCADNFELQGTNNR